MADTAERAMDLLVHAMDGLYVVAPCAGEPDEPRMWALHRMQE